MSMCFERFKRDESGAAAVELALWMPFFWLVFGLIVDATMLFQQQTQFVDVAREASRQVSIDKMTAVEAHAYILERFSDVENIEADILIDATSVTASVNAPISSLTVFSDLFVGSSRVNGKITMFMEEAVAPPAPAPAQGV